MAEYEPGPADRNRKKRGGIKGKKKDRFFSDQKSIAFPTYLERTGPRFWIPIISFHPVTHSEICTFFLFADRQYRNLGWVTLSLLPRIPLN